MASTLSGDWHVVPWQCRRKQSQFVILYKSNVLRTLTTFRRDKVNLKRWLVLLIYQLVDQFPCDLRLHRSWCDWVVWLKLVSVRTLTDTKRTSWLNDSAKNKIFNHIVTVNKNISFILSSRYNYRNLHLKCLKYLFFYNFSSTILDMHFIIIII